MKNEELTRDIRRVATEQGIVPPHWSQLRKALNEAGIKAPKGSTWGHDVQVKRYCLNYKVFETTTSNTDAPQDTTSVRQAEGEQHIDTASAFAEASSQEHGTSTTDAPQAKEQVPVSQPTTNTPQAELPDSTTCATQPRTLDSTTDATRLDPEMIDMLREVAAWWKRTRGTEIPVSAATREENTPEPAYRARFPGKTKNTGIRINQRLLRDALDKARTPDEVVKTGGGISPLVEYLLWGYLSFDPKYLHKEV